MENLNNVPSTGTFGNSINQVNQNFGLVKGAIENVEGRTIRSKGLFPTQAALIAAYPSPKVGDYAYVGSSLPATVYDCLVAGTWHNTQQQGGSESVPLNNYPTKSEMNAAIAAIEIETVDNLNEETAASGKALDAHQGFVLAGQIEDTKNKLEETSDKIIDTIKMSLANLTRLNLSSYSINHKYIDSSNVWVASTKTGNNRSMNIPVKGGEVYVLESNVSHGAIYALLKSNTTTGYPVDFSDSLDHRVVLSAGEKKVVEIPNDTTILYLFVETTNSTSNFLPSELLKGYKVQEIVSNINGNIENKNTSVPNMNALEYIYKDEIIDTSTFNKNSKYINSSNEWQSPTTTNQAKSINIPVNGGDVYKIEAQENRQAIYALLKSNTTTSYPVDFSDSLDHRVQLFAGKTAVVEIPSDTTILYLYAEGYGESYLPRSLKKLALISREVNSLGVSTPRYAYKKGVMMGDSITAGVYSYFNNGERWNGVQAGDGISDYIGEIMKCSVDNVGKRGTGYVADTRNINNALEQALVTDYSQYDFCVMMYGVNDYIQGMPLGSIEENLEGTVVGNMSRVFNKILSDNPYCKILCVGSYNTWGQVSQGGDYISNHPYGDETTDYALGYVRSTFTLRKYLDTQKEVCEHYHVQYFCLADEGFVNLINIKNVLVDGLHPTLELRKYIAQEIAKKLV